jgi:hypothetical protein
MRHLRPAVAALHSYHATTTKYSLALPLPTPGQVWRSPLAGHSAFIFVAHMLKPGGLLDPLD